MSLSPTAADLPTAASIAKLLAAPETSTRDRGVRLLSTYLPSLSPLPTTTTLLKIWKGLFFCFWHADGAIYQSSLATSIAALISSAGSGNPPDDLACLFLDAALATLRREWASIDYLRMDKFYLLVRRILNHSFQLLQANCWDSELVNRVMGIVEERALGVEGTKGFSYHVVEVFPEELARFLPVTRGTLEVLIAPFLRILESSLDPILVHKARVEVFMRFVVHGGRCLELKKAVVGEAEAEKEKGSDVENFGTIGLTMGFSERLLDLAKKEETVQANKKVLHELREGFFKLEKDLEKSGVEVSLPETEVPGEGLLGGQLPKKRKKKEKVAVEAKGEKKKEKKSKKKKKKMRTEENAEEPVVGGNGVESEENTDSGTKEDKENERGNENMISFDENVISNLQKQFEKAAAEAGMSVESKYETDNSLESTPVNPPKIKKKKKQAKSTGKLEMSSELELSTEDGNTGTRGENNITSSVKKVRFSMKNNLEWKPSSPMPPQSLRIPPSATPRGSALKKGVPPGPVRDISSPVAVKRRKPKAKSVKKVLKGSKSPSMAVKRLRKLQSLSA